MRIPPDSRPTLALIRDIGADKLAALINHLQSVRDVPLRTSELRREIEDTFGPNAVPVARQLVALSAIKRDNSLSSEELVRELNKGVEQLVLSGDWRPVDYERWLALESILVQLFSLSAIETVSKAVNLAYDYANLLSNAHVLTDIRPVFDGDGDRIVAAVVSQTIRIVYSSEDGEHSLSIVADEKDLHALRDSCERAIQKARTAKEFMGVFKVRAVISGEQNATK